MAKKKIEPQQDTTPMKPMGEMSDAEFISSADYLSSPYYHAYMSAKLSAEAKTAFATEEKQEAEQSKKGEKRYCKKRSVCIALILVFALLILAAAVIGYLNIEGVTEYLGIYSIPSQTEEGDDIFTLTDPIIALVKSVVEVEDLDSMYYDFYMADMSGFDTMTKISIYAVPVACLVVVLFALITVLKAIVALCAGKKEDGLYSKYKFGFLSVATILCGAIMFFGGLYVEGINLTDSLDFLTMQSQIMNVGYVLYAVIALPILNLILSCVAYKRQK